MNRKQLVILLVLVVLLGGIGLLLRKQQASSWTPENTSLGSKLMGDFPVNDVTMIRIAQGTNEVHLDKQSDIWRVKERGDYPANYSQISDVLIKLKDQKVIQSEQVGPSQLARFSLAGTDGTNGATLVEFKDKSGKNIRELLLGKKHMRKGGGRPSPFGDADEGWPDGRYVKVGATSDKVLLVGEVFANLEPRPEQWLDKEFFKVEKIKSLALTRAEETNSWRITRETETGEWKLDAPKEGEQLDSGKTSSFSSAFMSASFNDVVVDPKPAELGLDKPAVINIETFENFKYTLNVGAKTNDAYVMTLMVTGEFPKERTAPADEKAEDKAKLDKEFAENLKKKQEKLENEKAYEKWTYLVSSWTVDSVLKNRSELLAEKKPEPAPGSDTNAPPTEAFVPEIK